MRKLSQCGSFGRRRSTDNDASSYRFGTPNTLEKPLDLETDEVDDMGLADVPAAFRDVPSIPQSNGKVSVSPYAPRSFAELVSPPGKVSLLQGSQEEVQERAARRIQTWFRTRSMRGVSLNRRNLMARLQHEGLVFDGVLRLLNLLLIMLLMLIALQMSDNSAANFSIQQTLGAVFDIDAIEEAQTITQLWEVLDSVSESSKTLFPDSDQVYLSDYSPVTLINEMSTFTAPLQLLKKDALMVNLREFTFMTFVNLEDTFLGGNLARKSLMVDSELPCWSWSLSPEGTQVLSWGSHTFYDQSEEFGAHPDRTNYQVGGRYEMGHVRFGTMELITMVVRKTNVTFYYGFGLEMVETYDLDIPVTDCNEFLSNQVEVGSAGLTAGQMRFFPFALNPTEISEAAYFGKLLAHLAKGASYPQVEMDDSGASDQVSGEADMTASTDMVTYEHLIQLREIQHARAPAAHESNATYPPQPPGQVTPVSMAADTLVGQPYLSLLQTPVNLSAPLDYFVSRADVPAIVNQGTTLSFWFRPLEEAEEYSRAYILSSRTATDNPLECWGVWLWSQGFGLRLHFEDGTERSYWDFKHVIADQSALEKNLWRHVVLQFEVYLDSLRVFLDGAQVWYGVIGVPGFHVGEMDVCTAPSHVLSLAPSNMKGSDTQPNWPMALADVRLYSLDQPLSAAQVYAMATDLNGQVLPECTPSKLMLDDMTHTDDLGRTCAFYNRYQATRPDLCALPFAQTYCKLTCGRERCVDVVKSTKAYYLWDGIRHVVPHSKNGSVCLNDQMDKKEVLAQCRAYAATGEVPEGIVGDRVLYDLIKESKVNFGSTFVDVVDCDLLEQAIDPDCTFSADTVERFTQDVLEHNGDYTIFFWIRKPDSSQSKAAFVPGFTWFSSLSPPQHPAFQLAVRSGQGDNYLMQGQTFTCNGERHTAGVNMVEAGPVSEDDWTLIMLSRHNDTDHPSMSGGLNFGTFDQPGSGDWRNCLDGDVRRLFSAFEFDSELLITPIGLLPFAMDTHKQQEYWYQYNEGLQVRYGSSLPDRDLEHFEISVDKVNFANFMTMVGPPVLFQQRVKGSDHCGTKFAAKWIARSHEEAVHLHCEPPLDCSEEVKTELSSFLSCRGGPDEQPGFFGSTPLKFEGAVGFVDFLYSLTDNSFVPRGGEFPDTRLFLDGLTTVLEGLLVFFNPAYGVTTLMRITAEDPTGLSLEVDVSFSNLVIMEGTALYSYLAVQCLVLLNVTLMALDVTRLVRTNWQEFKTMYYPFPARKKPRTEEEATQAAEEDGAQDDKAERSAAWASLALVPMDVATMAIIVIVILNRLLGAIKSNSQTESIVGGIANMEWDDPSTDPRIKSMFYLSKLEELSSITSSKSFYDTLCLTALLTLLLRIIIATNCHPRLAILTGTVYHSGDDMWHTTILVVVLMACFGGIANWKFGAFRSEYTSFVQTVQTFVEMWFGGAFNDDWTEDSALSIMNILFLIVLFLLVLNFLLAIIVDAYTKVRELNDENEVELEFCTDVVVTFKSAFLARRNRYPPRGVVIEQLSQLLGKVNVSMSDLSSLDCFRDQHMMLFSFMQHYCTMECLEPKPVVQQSAHEPLINEMEKRTAWLLGRKPPTSRDHIFAHSRWRAAENETKELFPTIMALQQQVSQLATVLIPAAPSPSTDPWSADGVPAAPAGSTDPSLRIAAARQWPPPAAALQAQLDQQMLSEKLNVMQLTLDRLGAQVLSRQSRSKSKAKTSLSTYRTYAVPHVPADQPEPDHADTERTGRSARTGDSSHAFLGRL